MAHVQDTHEVVPASARSRRKYTSKACQECRRRRAKCNGSNPSCARCLERGIECRYSTETDNRRPAPKAYVELLRGRIELLERVLKSHNIDIDDSIAKLKVTEEQYLEQDAHDDTENIAHVPTSSLQFWEICNVIEGTLSSDDALNFEEDGEIRYFGPASGRLDFHIPQDAIDSQLSSTPTAPTAAPAAAPAASTPSTLARTISNSQFCVENDSRISDELREELIDLFFKWYSPWLQVVDEQLFRQGRATSGRYYSRLLENCILALGSRYSDALELRTDPADPNTAGRMFVESAELLLFHEMRWPSITTIQALALMNCVYVSIGADAAGWLRQGMAVRLALDMGFNLDAATLGGSVSMPPEEVAFRRQIYWAIYCDDKLASIYTGRVCTLLSWQASVEFPSIQIDAAHVDTTGSLSDVLIKLHKMLARVSKTLEKIILNLYAPQPLVGYMHRRSFFDACVLELKAWRYDLPTELRVDKAKMDPKLPQIFTLHMVFHVAHILLANAFDEHSKSSGQGVEAQTPLANRVSDRVSDCANKAKVLALDAAKQICAISRRYRDIYGSFRRSAPSAMHCNLLAAVTLIRATFLRGSQPYLGSGSDIEHCLKVLDELSVTWSTARKIRQGLIRMISRQRGCPSDSAGDQSVILSNITTQSFGMLGIATETTPDPLDVPLSLEDYRTSRDNALWSGLDLDFDFDLYDTTNQP